MFLYFVPSIKPLPCSGEKYVIFLLRHFSCFSCFGLVLHFLSHFVDFWSILMKLSELLFHWMKIMSVKRHVNNDLGSGVIKEKVGTILFGSPCTLQSLQTAIEFLVTLHRMGLDSISFIGKKSAFLE